MSALIVISFFILVGFLSNLIYKLKKGRNEKVKLNSNDTIAN